MTHEKMNKQKKYEMDQKEPLEMCCVCGGTPCYWMKLGEEEIENKNQDMNRQCIIVNNFAGKLPYRNYIDEILYVRAFNPAYRQTDPS